MEEGSVDGSFGFKPSDVNPEFDSFGLEAHPFDLHLECSERRAFTAAATQYLRVHGNRWSVGINVGALSAFIRTGRLDVPHNVFTTLRDMTDEKLESVIASCEQNDLIDLSQDGTTFTVTPGYVEYLGRYSDDFISA